jgi:putative aldouronate transport system substrate-binding protein
MRIMVRNLAIVTILALAAATGFAAGEGEDSGSAGEYTLSPPGVYPVVQPMYEFDAVTIYSSVESSGKPQDSKLTPYLEGITNVRVNFIDVIESGAAGEKINLMLASGDVPDVIMTPWHINAQTTFQHGINGTFIRLNDIIDQHMPALKRELEKWPQYAAQLTMPDGGIYNLPELEAGCFHCQYSIKFWMYQPWFDKLGLSFPPTTTDELYEVLKAFKTGDPNGNGMADEIPMLGATTGWNALPTNFLMNAFAYTRRGTYGGYLERASNGVRFVANTPEWREGLRYIHRLYAEELIGRETFTQKNDQAKATIENPDTEMVGSFPAGWFGVMTVNGGGTGRFAHFKPIGPLKGPAGAQHVTHFPPAIRYHTFITPREEHPEIVAQWANWFYDDPLVAASLSWDFLQEGVDWRYLTAEDVVRQAGSGVPAHHHRRAVRGAEGVQGGRSQRERHRRRDSAARRHHRLERTAAELHHECVYLHPARHLRRLPGADARFDALRGQYAGVARGFALSPPPVR